MDRLHESPTRHDVEFFVRKVNRYEAEIVQLEETMSLLKFRLSKAEDYQAKYDQLFKANQDTTQLLEVVAEEKERGDRENDRLRVELEQAKLSVRNLSLELENAKRSVEDQRAKREELRNKASSDDAEERGAIK